MSSRPTRLSSNQRMKHQLWLHKSCLQIQITIHFLLSIRTPQRLADIFNNKMQGFAKASPLKSNSLLLCMEKKWGAGADPLNFHSVDRGRGFGRKETEKKSRLFHVRNKNNSRDIWIHTHTKNIHAFTHTKNPKQKYVIKRGWGVQTSCVRNSGEMII